MLLSIITINLNNAAGLKKTLHSVAEQGFDGLEFLVIDGGSNDGSLELIKENKTVSKWLSEKDAGIYDAQNKGIEMAQGKFLFFLNSGDIFFNSEVLRKFKQASGQFPEAGIIYGDVATGEGKTVSQNMNLDLMYFYHHTLNHQATFIRKSLFEKYGYYTADYRISSDYEFFLKVYLDKPSEFKYIPFTVSVFDMGGFSQDPKNFSILEKERTEIQKKYLSEAQWQIINKVIRRSWPWRDRLAHAIDHHPLIGAVLGPVRSIYRKLKNKR